jgi:iron-sulfur cluster repair protein YtfE (RIC family)
MKRHDALIQLSHEHHHGLVWAKRMYDLPDDAPVSEQQELLDEFFPIWHDEINPHFRNEEEILLPLFDVDADPDVDCIRLMLQQHVHIRRDVLLLEFEPNLEVIHRLGNALKEHIRLEEREVFPLVEEKASQETLDAIQSQIEK